MEDDLKWKTTSNDKSGQKITLKYYLKCIKWSDLPQNLKLGLDQTKLYECSNEDDHQRKTTLK